MDITKIESVYRLYMTSLQKVVLNQLAQYPLSYHYSHLVPQLKQNEAFFARENALSDKPMLVINDEFQKYFPSLIKLHASMIKIII